jgi:hypothetical protein
MSDKIVLQTETRTTEFLVSTHSALIINQTSPESEHIGSMIHYTSPGYNTFATLLMAGWYYGLAIEEPQFDCVLPGSFFDDPMIFTKRNLETLWKLLSDGSDEIYTEEGDLILPKYDISTGRNSYVQPLLKDEGIEFNMTIEGRLQGTMLFEKEIISDALSAIIDLRAFNSRYRSIFKEFYNYFQEESKKHISPYKAPDKI